jgi:hypothetical protein
MTEQMERYLRETFNAEERNAPQISGLAQAARKRAGMQRRRRVATAAGSLLAAVGVASTSFVMWGPQAENAAPVEPAVTVQQPKFTGPLTREECHGYLKHMNGGYDGGPPEFYPAEKQARNLVPSILKRYPNARMVKGKTSADQVEFLYVLPNGYRVARILIEPGSPAGWYVEDMGYCWDGTELPIR